MPCCICSMRGFGTRFCTTLGWSVRRKPFKKLVHQGIVLGEDNQKMSKSRGNVVNPDEIMDQFGADAVRLYEMFMGRWRP